MPIEAALLGVAKPPLYQQIAEKVLHLHQLELNRLRISKNIGVDDKTVAKALRWILDNIGAG